MLAQKNIKTIASHYATLTSVATPISDVVRLHVKQKLMTETYHLQGTRTALSENQQTLHASFTTKIQKRQSNSLQILLPYPPWACPTWLSFKPWPS